MILLLALAFLAPPAAAQEPAEPETIDGIDEIIVTITRRDESVQEIAGTVSAFGSEELEELGIESLSDVIGLIPGVQTKGARASAITIRGISQSFTTGSQSPVARHVNGIFRYDDASYLGQFYDLQGVEVMRGPVGTIQGRNATAGALNVVWKKPHAAYEVGGDVTLGNYDHYQFRGFANVPLLGEGDERLMARFVVQREIHDGYVDNLLSPAKSDPDRGDDTDYRLSLRSVLSEDVGLTLRGWKHKRHSKENAFKAGLPSFREGRFPTFDALTGGPVPFDSFNGLQNMLLGTEANAMGALYAFGLVTSVVQGVSLIEGMQQVLLNGAGPVPPVISDPSFFVPAPADPSSDRETLSRANELANGETEFWGVDGALEWRIHDVPLLGDLQLDVGAGWQSWDNTFAQNADGSSIFLIDNVGFSHGQTFTSELRLSSQNEGPVSWIAGLFYFERDFDSEQAALGFFGVAAGTTVRELTGWAPFLHVSYAPIEEVEIFGGVRWNRDTFEQATVAEEIPGIRLASSAEGEERYRETTRDVGVRWFVTDDLMAYVKFSKGYKAGFVELETFSGTVNPVGSEIVKAWEAGIRSEWLDGRLTVNLTAYDYDYTDLQVPVPTGLQALTENAAAAEIQGAELEATIVLRPGWIVQVAASYLDATFGAFCSSDPFQFSSTDAPTCASQRALDPSIGMTTLNDVNGLLDLSGHRLEDTPEWDFSITSRYTFDLGEWGTLTPVVSFRWVDDYYSRPFNIEIDEIDSYTQTDLRLIWRSMDERYSIEIFGEHLEDNDIYGRRVVPPEFIANPVKIGYFTPRLYGIRLGFHWGGN